MQFQRLATHDTKGFDFTGTWPSPIDQDAIHDVCLNLAECFIKEDITAKDVTLVQKFMRGRQNSVQVLMLCSKSVTIPSRGLIRLPLHTENAGLDDPNTAAWLQLRSDGTVDLQPFLLVRKDPDSLNGINPFFGPFINQIKSMKQ